MASDAQISHVSDTALMAAACRAMETARQDAMVRDPLAERLAGERGMAIARSIPRLELMAIGISIRTRFLDELVAEAVTGLGVSTVVSVGAGLDTRPWRLDLPADLRWIEVDFPAMLDYKAATLASERPNCRLERVAADLNDASQRQAMFESAGNTTGLMITEGLLMYLPAETVEALAVESVERSGIRFWLLDVASAELVSRLKIDSTDSIENVRARNHLSGGPILDLLAQKGWSPLKRLTYVKDSRELSAGRVLAPIDGQPLESLAPPPADDPSGVHLYGRSGYTRLQT